MEFENNLDKNLLDLHRELISHTYKPKPLETFILRDPKTRKISKSDFRDRVIHHAIYNIIEPLFERNFIAERGVEIPNHVQYKNYLRKLSKSLRQS